MKTLLFLLFPCICFVQITQRDTIVDIGGTLYLQHIITSSELLVDTLKIRARIDEIDKTIIELQAEREKKVALISDFEEKKSDFILRQPKKRNTKAKKQPATLPKQKKN